MGKNLIALQAYKNVFISSKPKILADWILFASVKEILQQHDIEAEKFLQEYANGVFDYFMGIISNEQQIGYCPIMQNLLTYLKDKEVCADELFEICNYFRRSMIGFSYENKIDSKELLDELSYIFDKNFRGILKYYTDTIFAKEQEVNRSSKLLSEYKKALDESALISKTDLEGKITYVNEKFVELCGYDEKELLGNKHNIIKHEDMDEEFYKYLWMSLKKENLFRGTIKNKKKNGDYFHIDTTIVKINDPHDNSTEYMSISYDVTKLIDARVEAQRASQAKEYFLSNMSHEIRTPLNAILGFVNLLIDEDISHKHRKYLDIIFNSGENLLSIINDILDFSKLRSGEFTIEPKIFSLHDELSHTMELFVASANAKNLTITSFIDPHIPKELYADALRIKQILSNFLSNAIKFTPNNGIISVEAICNNKVLSISVSDNGIGISKDDIKNIFLAFAQAQYSELKNCGTGLGLSICHQLAKHMNGDVFVESKVGEGSKFWLEIPVDIYTQTCQIFDEVKEFQSLKMVMYAQDGITSYKHESFLKYAHIFDMDIKVVDNLDVDFDVALFVHEEIDEKLRKKIIYSQKKYIALMSKIYDDYEKYMNIVSLSFPLYCSKIKSVYYELLNPNYYSEYSQNISLKFDGHILIAEDNEANQELIKILLLKYGLTFDLANNGLEALELYKLNHYDLILMDEQMPIMDGNRCVKEILQYEREQGISHIPVAALTANVIKGAKERGLLSGYDAFLGKPIILKDMERVFSNYLNLGSKNQVNNNYLSDFKSVQGVDMKKLSEELMLNDEELKMLLELFVQKMQKVLPDLQKAIIKKDYENIAVLAHNIKGSSSNFRIELLQESATKIETMAKQKKESTAYEELFEIIQTRIEQIIM